MLNMERKKTIKAICLLMIAITIFFTLQSPITYADNNTFSLKSLVNKSGEECILELEKTGVKLPKVYDDPKQQSEAVKMVICDLNEGKFAGGLIPYNYTELVKLAETITEIVAKNDPYLANTTLVNSTVLGSWNDSYLGYNCYGHAIGVNRFENPGYYSNKPFSTSLSIGSMADLVIADLDKLGYWAVKTTTKPSFLASYKNMICIRKGNLDYHFMKGNQDVNYWTHKPGNTNLLKWNYSSPGATIWSNELSFKGVVYPADTTYNSQIYYITYWSKDSGPMPYNIDVKIKND